MMAELDILNGFVGKIISDCIDISINAIKKADKDRKSKNRTMETRIYQVIIDSLNYFTYNNYKGNDKLYYASESILKGLKSGKGSAEVVKSGLKMLVLDINDDICQEFLGTIYREICRDENNDLYKEIVMVRQEQGLEDLKKITQNQNDSWGMLGDIKEDTRYIRESLNKKEAHGLEHCNEIPIENRADEYVKKWDKNVFLNDFNEEDQNAGVNIRLSDIYIEECLPHYIWKTNPCPSDKLRNLLTKYIIDVSDKKMLLILGQPGIGKSTLITWIMANLAENMGQMLVYQFASDLGKVDWQNNNTLDEIFKAIGYSYRELEGKTLILDGFDEIYVKDDRERILYKMNQELKKKNFLKTFSIIITCRENYLDKLKLKEIEYITLQAWDEEQIKSFCEVYEKENAKNGSKAIDNINLRAKINKILENKEVFGIPLILYMVLALNIAVEENSSVVDIYDQVFSLERGGIYDRRYDAEHRINDFGIKKHIHHISQRIAFWMFENNADKAIISQKKFEEICDDEMSNLGKKDEEIQRDILIGNFFKLKYCEGKGTSEIQFAHRTIYEYFVVTYFYESLYKLKAKEQVAGKLGELLKAGNLSEQTSKFIKCKFDNIDGYNFADITKDVFNIMLRDGMTYHFIKEQKRPLLNIIDREMNVFSNMLEVVGLWNLSLGRVDKKIITYLQHNKKNSLNLIGVSLRRVDLSEVDLSGANLSGADLSRADLSRANLSGADLSKANLSEANLSGVFLIGANLSEANLSRADLSNASLVKANLSGANLSVINLSEANLLGADLSGADLGRADLSKAYLSGTDLSKANLSGSDLSGTYLSEANLIKTDLIGKDLKRADLVGKDLRGAYLGAVDLRGVDLSELDLRKTYLRGANLIEANLRGADLREADLIRVNLREADLSRTYLSGTNLGNADLRGANLGEADLRRSILIKTNLRSASLIEADLREVVLIGANLRGANLRGADLRNVSLSEADLIQTIFDESQVKLLCEKYDITDSRVYISETREIISYKEYCHKNRV